MVDEITKNSKTSATESPVSDIPDEPASEPIQPVNSSESAGGILLEETPIEPVNSPLENPIEMNSEIKLENTIEEPTIQTQEQTQEISQAIEPETIKPISQPQIEEPITQKEIETQKVSQEAVEPKQPEPEIKNETTKPESVKTEEQKIPINSVLITVPNAFELNMRRARELLVKARAAIQFRKRKKLDKIMTLFLKKDEIRNDDVEKLLHVSDATATVYLSILKKENKIKTSGKKGVRYSYVKV